MDENMKNALLHVYYILDEMDSFFELHYTNDMPIQGNKLLDLARMNYEALEMMYEIKEQLTAEK